MDRIENELNYNREMLITLGLLLGCDYDPKGVSGVGKENACKFLDEIVGLNKESETNGTDVINILDRIRSWSTSTSTSTTSQTKMLKYEERIKKHVLEQYGNKFPNEAIIKEYTHFSRLARTLLSEQKYLKIKWSRPNLNKLQVFHLILFQIRPFFQLKTLIVLRFLMKEI
jgi:5'-3' exonuclease